MLFVRRTRGLTPKGCTYEENVGGTHRSAIFKEKNIGKGLSSGQATCAEI
jgi:hypothetical protein